MKLPDSTIDLIRKEIGDRGIRNQYLQSELCDHIASDMEQMMDQGMNEEEAWIGAFQKTTGDELESTARQFSGILNSRYYRLKILLWITFGLFATSWLFARPIGLYAAVLSFVTLGVTLVILSFDFFRSRKNHKANTWFSAGSMLSALLVMSGFILLLLMVRFSINTRGHSVDLMIFSYVILSLVICFYFLRQKKLSISAEGKITNTWFAIFSGMQLFFAVLALLTFPFYEWTADYIWILIWAILAVDLVSLALLFIRKIRNILFMILLLLSFMITFIHSPLRRLLPVFKAPITLNTEP